MIRILDNDNLSPIFESASPMRVDVKDEKRATRNTVETGATRSDHVVDALLEVGIDFILTDSGAREQFDQIREYYEDHRLVTIQCRMGAYVNMLIEAMPHTETASILNGVSVPVRFVEWNEIAPEYGQLRQDRVANPEWAGSQQRGRQTGSETDDSRGGSILYRLSG